MQTMSNVTCITKFVHAMIGITKVWNEHRFNPFERAKLLHTALQQVHTMCGIPKTSHRIIRQNELKNLGEFNWSEWAIELNASCFDPNNMQDSWNEQNKVGERIGEGFIENAALLYHEGRHCEQWWHMARYVAHNAIMCKPALAAPLHVPAGPALFLNYSNLPVKQPSSDHFNRSPNLPPPPPEFTNHAANDTNVQSSPALNQSAPGLNLPPPMPEPILPYVSDSKAAHCVANTLNIPLKIAMAATQSLEEYELDQNIVKLTKPWFASVYGAGSAARTAVLTAETLDRQAYLNLPEEMDTATIETKIKQAFEIWR